MTHTKTRQVWNNRQQRNNRTKTRSLTRDQEKALGDLAMLAGPAFAIGLWGVTALLSGLVSLATSLV